MKQLIYKNYISLFLIIVISSFLYLFELGNVPSGLYVDEAAHGYNAFSILKTGRDEYGQPFPIAFKFFSTFTPPLYTYLTVIPIKFMGLSVFAARFISALSGILLSIFFYLFLKGLKLSSKATPLIGAILLATSPWELMFARSGYEANLGLFFFFLGIYFLWKGLVHDHNLILGFIILSASIYTSFTIKFLAPIFLIAFFAAFRNKFLTPKKRKLVRYSFILFLLIQLPNIYLLTTPSFFIKSKLLHSQSLINIPYEFLSQYLNYFSPRSLFLHSDPDLQRSIPTLSALFPWMLIPYLIGIYQAFHLKDVAFRKFLWLTFLITPIPAALVGDPFSSYRALPFLIPTMIVIALGVDALIRRFKATALITMFLLISVSLIYLWRGYFVFFPKERSAEWNYGYDQLAQLIQKSPNEKFLVTLNNHGPIYINLLFYLKYDPSLYQKQFNTTDYYHNTQFNSDRLLGNVVVRSLDFKKDTYTNQTIIVDSNQFRDQNPTEHKLTRVFEIIDPLGGLLYHGFKTNPIQKCEAYLRLKELDNTEKSEQCDNLNYLYNLED